MASCQFKVAEIKSWRDGAPNQHFFTGISYGSEPVTSLDHNLKTLTSSEIAAKLKNAVSAIMLDLMYTQTATGVVIPDFIRF